MSKVLIVTANYYKDISNGLLRGASNILNENNILFDSIEVPGCFEISLAIKYSMNTKIYSGYISLGCIIKGQTSNFDLISNAITNGIMNISILQKKPIGNSILTLFNRDQANQRYDKGKEAAIAVLEVLKIK